MADYTRSTGSSGTMMIRDTNPGGSTGAVEYWLNSNNGSTFNHSLPWSHFDNGNYSGALTHNYNAGSGWNFMGSVTIAASQTVNFSIGNTGTSGFGGPTSFDQFITRATVPDAPNAPTFTNVQPTTLDVNWTPNGNGGAAITDYEIAYGTNPSSPSSTVTSATSPKGITGLTPGTTYYFKVRAQNSVGWSAFSTQTSIMTIAGVRVRSGGVWKIAVPYVRFAGVWRLARPYVKVSGVWKETI